MNNLLDIYKYNHYKTGYLIKVSFNRDFLHCFSKRIMKNNPQINIIFQMTLGHHNHYFLNLYILTEIKLTKIKFLNLGYGNYS